MAFRRAFAPFGNNLNLAVIARSPRPTFSLRTLATSTSSTLAFDNLSELCKGMSDITAISRLATWDERVMMPPDGVKTRGRHKAVLATILHEKATSKELEDAITAAKRIPDLDKYEQATVRDADRNFNLAKDVTVEIEQNIQVNQVEARVAWAKAKAENDYPHFEPFLRKAVDLHKEKARMMRKDHDPYDTMLDTFERDMTAVRLVEIFDQIKQPLIDLIEEVLEKKNTCEREVHPALVGHADWDMDKQLELAAEVAQELGYDLDRGRIDKTSTAFAAPMSSDDVRVATRGSKDEWYRCLKITCHEAGHAMYEQGKNVAYEGLPVGQALSIGMHESQSLFYERMITRNLPFWQWVAPKFHEKFPHTKSVTADDMYFAANQVEKGLTRSNADELTYPLHIILRFELEREMFGDMDLKDLPQKWNAKIEEYLGLDVPSDTEGCLQDGHWSIGNLGYFPGYLIGAMVAAQLYRHLATLEIGIDIEGEIRAGNFEVIRNWLKKEVHEVGSLHPSLDKLLEEITGEPLNPDHFFTYLKDKYTKLYA